MVLEANERIEGDVSVLTSFADKLILILWNDPWERDLGGISGRTEYFRDVITEEVGCKSGLLLTDAEAYQLLLRKDHREAKLFDTDRDQMIRFRPEEVEGIILNLRHQIGNLPDVRYGAYNRIVWMKKLHAQGINVAPIYDAFGTIIRSGKYKVIGEEADAEMVQLSGMSELLVAQFLMHVATQMDRSMNWFSIQSVDLEWAIPLRSVFESETIPDDPDEYLDQRYIDYFVHNGEDLQKLHWRNFERLTTEFFRRHGYEGSARARWERRRGGCPCLASWR